MSWGVDNATGRYNVYMDNNLQSNGSAPIVFGVNITGKNGQRVNGYCDAYDGYSQSEVADGRHVRLPLVPDNGSDAAMSLVAVL